MRLSGKIFFQTLILCFFLAVSISVVLEAGAASSVITVQELKNGVRDSSGEKRELFFEETGSGTQDGTSPDQGTDSGDCNIVIDQGEKPRIAIIIDDMGYHQRIGKALLDLDMNLTFSFLPYGPFTRTLEERAWQEDRDVLVHVPMEPQDSVWDPGPGALYLADQPEVRARNAEENLAAVPHAIGANNHMGSRFTEDSDAMRQFLVLLKEKDLFFIDSITSSRSIGMETARAMGIKTARRQVFLDNVQTQKDICRQLKLLVKKAVESERGSAIGIGHPNDATLTALTKCRTMLIEQVQVVGISELIR